MNSKIRNNVLAVLFFLVLVAVSNIFYKHRQIDTTPILPDTVAPTEQPISTQSGAIQEANRTKAAVTKIVDGDTIHVLIGSEKEIIRVIGIDTPETVDPRKPVQCFGKEATEQAIELLAGKTIYLESDDSQSKRDRYGRLLAYIFFENNTDYGKYMIENGFAHEYTYNTPYRYQVEYRQAQEQAIANKSGLWNDNVCSR